MTETQRQSVRLTAPDRIASSIAEYRAIIAALCLRDADKAQWAMVCKSVARWPARNIGLIPLPGNEHLQTSGVGTHLGCRSG